MSASAKAIALVLDDRLAELLAGLGVVERHLVGRPRDADRLRADGGAGALEGRHARVAAARRRPRGRGPAGRRASPCRRAGSGPGTRTSSSTTSAVWEARMPCLWNFWPWLSPFVPGGTTKLAWPRVRRSGSTTAVTTWTSAMPPLVAQVLVPLMHPLVGRLVVAGAGAHRADVAAGVGLGGAERAEPAGRPGVPNISRHPLADLLVGAVGAHAGGGQRGADDREPDAGVAPEELLHRDRDAEAGLVEALGGEEVERVDAGLGGLLDHRPGELLLLVPLGRGRADHVGGEGVQPVAELAVVGARSKEGSHGSQANAGPEDRSGDRTVRHPRDRIPVCRTARACARRRRRAAATRSGTAGPAANGGRGATTAPPTMLDSSAGPARGPGGRRPPGAGRAS